MPSAQQSAEEIAELLKERAICEAARNWEEADVCQAEIDVELERLRAMVGPEEAEEMVRAAEYGWLS